MGRTELSRRDFIKGVAAGAVGMATFGALNACASPASGAATAAPETAAPTTALAETAAAPDSGAIYKAGTYTSEQSTGFAKVTITTEFDETSILSVNYEVTETGDNDYFPDYESELQALCKEIVSSQDSEVDSVSGATLCSGAIKSGVKDCIAQSSLQPVETAAPGGEAKAGGDFKQQVSDWLYDKETVASASGAGAFLPGEENVPTEEELCRILETANNYQWCHMLTAPHFIVIRDKDEQHEILQEMGVTGDGTATILVLADGLKDQEHHEEAYDGRDHEGQHYWRMYYCIYEAGEAAAMLNLAACSLGYRTRNYGALHIYNQGVKDQFPDGDGVSIWFAGGNFDYIGGDNWDISKYCSPKNGGERFKHWFGGGYVDGEMSGKYVDVENNLTLLCAIVIGKVNEVDAASSATVSDRSGLTQKKYNYNFWD